MMGCMSKISDRLKQIKGNIASSCQRAGREPEQVKLIIVTKTAPLEAVKEVIRLGYVDIGESRVQHLKQISGEVEKFIEDNKDNPKLPKKINCRDR